MENLPFLFLKELFGMMPGLNEVIRCSHVCRNWRAAYEALVKPETLCLHFEKLNRLVPLNHRLFYTNDPVSKFCFLKIARSSDELQFFDSLTTQFLNIKKLIILSPFSSHSYDGKHLKESLKINLKDQLNHFKALEYCEIHCQTMVVEDCEINLPNLKVLCVGWCDFEAENARIALNTPSLKAMKFTGGWFCFHQRFYLKKANITQFKFLFPSALRHLEMIIYDPRFKFEAQFENLEVLVFSRKSQYGPLGGDFLESLPSLKFLFLHWPDDYLLTDLEEAKQKFNLNDLKIFAPNIFRLTNNKFDYSNWPWYLKQKKQLPYWPGEFELVFDKLVDFQVPLDLFKKNYFETKLIKVRQVDDQLLLVDLLRNVRVAELELEYDCNLGQSFIDQIVDSAIILDTLTLDECVFNRMNDFSGFARLNILHFKLNFQQLQAEAPLAVLRNPLCVSFTFMGYMGLCIETEEDEREEDGEIRKYYNTSYIHLICRSGNDLKCISCGWTDTNCFENPVATAQHAVTKPPWKEAVFQYSAS